MEHISYSQIRKLMTCPKAWELDKVVGVKIPTAAPLFLGSTIHLTYSTFQSLRIDGSTMTLEDTKELFETLFAGRVADDEVYWKNTTPEDQFELGLDMVRAYYPNALKITPTDTEVTFSTRLIVDGEEIELTGKIDLIDYEGVSYDIKTARYVPTEMKAIDLLQPAIYTMCMGAESLDKFIYHYILKTKIASFRNKSIEIEKKTVTWLKEVCLPLCVRQIRSGIFPPNVSGCHLCDYRLFGSCQGFP